MCICYIFKKNKYNMKTSEFIAYYYYFFLYNYHCDSLIILNVLLTLSTSHTTLVFILRTGNNMEKDTRVFRQTSNFMSNIAVYSMINNNGSFYCMTSNI